MKLGELIEIKGGGTPSKEIGSYWNGEIPWATVKDLNNEYLSSTIDSITFEGLKNSASKIVEAGNLIMATRMAVGKVVIPQLDVAINQDLKGLYCSGNIDTKYLFYYLKSKSPYFQSVATGATVKGIKIAHIADLEIELPPLEEQKKIAAILDAADTLRQKDKALIAKYEELTQSLFLDMFGNLKGEKICLDSVCEINPKKSEISSLDKGTVVSFIPMSNVSERGVVDLTEVRAIEEVWSGFTYFKEGDVAFAKITPCMENGKGGIMNGLRNGIGFGTTEFHVLRPLEGRTNSAFLYFLTVNKEFRKTAESEMTGSAGQKRVPKSFFSSSKIVLPPITLQNQFAERVQQIENQKQLAQQSLQKSEELFNSLLQRAFKGELTKTLEPV